MIKSLYGKKPFYVSKETWESLTDKERDFVCLIHSRKGKWEIMRRLYLTERTSYWRLQEKVRAKLKPDVDKFNDSKIILWKSR